jgi:hypothetical protein
VADESISWPVAPSVTDANDGTQCYNMGRVFTLTADAPVVGVEWRVPDSVATPNGTHAVALWDQTSGTRLAYQEVVPTPGDYQQFLFDPGDIHDGLTTETLIAAVYMNHYCYDADEGIGSTSPSGTAVAGEMLLVPFNGGAATAPIPDQATTLNFYVSPIVSVGDDPAEGSADIGLDLSLAATGARDSAGSVDIDLGLSLAATGSSPNGGSAAFSLDLSLAATGARDSTGSADIGLDLSLAATGARDSTGSADIGLDLSLAATGSNGDVGCPVAPFPWAPRAGSATPWSPRTVASFPGGECT